MKSFSSFDGTKIAYHDLGDGPLVLMLHGFSGNAHMNYVAPGIADKVVSAGYRAILPDFRGHGASECPSGDRAWPRDAAARDQIALLNHLETDLHAIIGYSFGSIVALRLHLLTRLGKKLIIGGVGHVVADEWDTRRNDAFRKAIEEAQAGQDTPEAAAILERARLTGGTLEGYLGAMMSSRVYTPADLLATFRIPTCVITGDKDFDNGSGEKLAEIIPSAVYRQVKGDHITAVGDPALSEAIVEFL